MRKSVPRGLLAFLYSIDLVVPKLFVCVGMVVQLQGHVVLAVDLYKCGHSSSSYSLRLKPSIYCHVVNYSNFYCGDRNLGKSHIMSSKTRSLLINLNFRTSQTAETTAPRYYSSPPWILLDTPWQSRFKSSGTS